MIADYRVDRDIMVERGVSPAEALEICVYFNALDGLRRDGYMTRLEYEIVYRRLIRRMRRLERV